MTKRNMRKSNDKAAYKKIKIFLLFILPSLTEDTWFGNGSLSSRFDSNGTHLEIGMTIVSFLT